MSSCTDTVADTPSDSLCTGDCRIRSYSPGALTSNWLTSSTINISRRSSQSWSPQLVALPLSDMQLFSLAAAVALLLASGAAVAPGSLDLRSYSNSCDVHNKFFYNLVEVSNPPTNQTCGDTLLATLRGKGLVVTEWKCEKTFATFHLPVIASSVQTLANILDVGCFTWIGGSGSVGNGNQWDLVTPSKGN